jgi:hypothetical protein
MSFYKGQFEPSVLKDRVYEVPEMIYNVSQSLYKFKYRNPLDPGVTNNGS